MRRYLCMILVFLILLPLLVSCKEGKTDNEEAYELTSVNYRFQNFCDEYAVYPTVLTTYYVNQEHLPYLDILDFLLALEGFFRVEDIYHITRENEHELELYWKSGSYAYRFVANWEEDTIFVNNIRFFSHTQELLSTDYNLHNKVTDYYSASEKSVTFDLGAYYFDIIYYEEHVLIPFHILNTLFCSTNLYNIYFNGDAYYGVMENGTGCSTEEILQIKTSSLNGTECPSDLRYATLNHVLFIMDYFYGLMDDKNIEYFKQMITGNDVNLFLSGKPDEFMQAYINIFQKKLDELHTTIGRGSFYHQPEEGIDIYAEENAGNFRILYDQLSEELNQLSVERWPNGIPPVRFADNTAIIFLDGFEVGSKYEIYNGNQIKPDAWRYDSFERMRYAMKEIEEHGGIDSIILDLSQNSGGRIGAMIDVLGFLTDQRIPYSQYNCLTNEYSISYYEVDINGDGDYQNDAYDEYDWYILSSLNTFSAANTFVSICKKLQLATVIGEKTGGGMCTVMSNVLVDGTSLRISSNHTVRTVVHENGKDIYYSIENGIQPDCTLSHLQFYSDDKLLDALGNQREE